MSTIGFSHLRLLAIFVTVVESGSFAAAARKLHSSRSRISEQITDLEQDLGVRLLQRSTRQLKVTSEGMQVYEQANKLPDILQSIETITKPQTPKGRVAITMNHDIAHKFILPVLNDFQSKYPEVKLDLILDDMRLDLIDEKIDLAIRIGVPKSDSVSSRIMHEEDFALFASPTYLNQVGKLKAITDLEKCNWVMLMQSGYSDVLRLRQHGKTIEIRPKQFSRCNSPLMMQQMVKQGVGVGMLLPTTVKKEIEQGELIQVLPSLTSGPIIFSLVYPSRHQMPLRTQVVMEFLLEANLFT